MIQRIREHVLYGTLLVVLLAFVAAAFYGVDRLSESQRSLGKRLPGETLWAATQTEIELLRLSLALSSFIQGEIGAEEVALRIDIFWSQAGLLESGDIGRSIAALPEHSSTLRSLRDALNSVDRLLPQFGEGGLEAVNAAQEMRAQLAVLSSPLHALSISVVQSDLAARTARIGGTLEILREVTWFFVAALVSAGVIGLGLVVGRRKLQREVRVRKRAEDALGEREERYRHLIEHSQGLICIHDMEGTITLVNSAAAQALGLEQNAMIGHCLIDFLAPSARHEFDEYLQRVAAQGNDSGLLRVQTADGGERVWAYKNTVYSPTNQPPHVLGNAQDITKLMRTEHELHFALQTAERASHAKSDFLAQMSHELRTPMNSILGFGQLINSDRETPLDNRHAAMMDRILDAGRHLLGLINEILDLAKIESGGVDLQMGAVSVTELMGECIELSQSATAPSSVKIENHLAGTGCPFVWADETRLKQVFLNLLSNAVKYNVPQGQVSITWHSVAAGRVTINFNDTGPGIEEAELGELFRPFHRLGAERSGIEGTGIGLVIAKRLAESMQGKLTVDSTAEIGSTFSVELMQAPGTNIPVPVVDNHRAGTKKGRGRESIAPHCLVLHIEDEPSNLWLMQAIMGRYPGIQLLDAPNAQTGLSVAFAREPDIILLDINLPDMNGFEVFERLAADARTHAIPIIAVSADAMSDQIERAMDLGFFGYITKPFVIDELVAIIDQARFALTEGAGRLSRMDVNRTIH